jgi:hypothetical protein
VVPVWVAKTRPFRVNGELRNLPTSIDYFDPNKHPNDAAEVWRLLNLNVTGSDPAQNRSIT